MRLAVTGATGYIGARLVRQALDRGYRVVALTRRKPSSLPIEWLPFDIANDSEIDLPPDIDALVHLAAETQVAAVDMDSELAAARRLIRASKRCNARFIFVSSQTARPDAPTNYGQSKWRIEQETLAAGGLAVRPGLVYGGPERALFGKLVSAVRSLPVIPAFLPSPEVQPVHVDDLATALITVIASHDMAPTILSVGSETPIGFTSFLRCIAQERLHRPRIAVPVPVVGITLLTKLMGSTLSSRLSLDRLTSLFELPMMDTGEDLRRLGLDLRPLSRGMARSGNNVRRRLLLEARALMTYSLRSQPTSVLIRRYVRCIEELRGGAALEIPDFVLRAPSAIALLEARGEAKDPKVAEFLWRVNAATFFAEASPQSAARFLDAGRPSSFVRSALKICRALGCEIGWRIGRILIGPFLAPAMRRRGLWT